MRRITLALLLSGCAALVAGCTNGGAVPPPGGFGRGMPSLPEAMSDASRYSIIHSFSSAEGNTPQANPIVDAAGRLYGTTVYGGSGTCGSGCGTIYQLSPGAHGTWKDTTLWSFDLTHGAYPGYPLVADAALNLYGATDVGDNLGVAYGLFHSANGRQLRDLHDFQGNRDGQQPRSSLIFDKVGNLYGTTVAGGTGGSGGGGTVYELTPSGGKWNEKILYRFTPYSNGANPQAPVVFGRHSGLYGTTSYGGNTACPTGCGVVFKLTQAGKDHWTEAVLHAFAGSDGCTSTAGLVANAEGNFYGSTNLGGPRFPTCFGGCGTLFELARGSHGHWSFAVIHNFAPSTGCGPSGNMLFDAAGNLYGTTVIGGNGGGVVFKLTPQASHRWKYTVLHTFTNTPDGWEATGLAMGASGKLYGTTISGGKFGIGTVFEITP